MSWKRKQCDKKQIRTRGRRWMRMRNLVLIEEPVCMVCGRRAATQVDHKIPLSKGGTDDRDNLQGICDGCHDDKTNKDLGMKHRVEQVGLDGYPIPKE